MKVLFCNITPMNRYEGVTEKDKITKGAGAWVSTNLDAHEKWNFLNQDGKCYGFVQNPGNYFHIERYKGVSSSEAYTDGVMVVFCAPKHDGTTAVVGWYENARVYREYQKARLTGLTGIERYYFAEAAAEDCYLLPVENRTFIVPRAAKAGTGKGFGQENFWYAESVYAREELIPALIKFCDANREGRINHTSGYFMPEEKYEDSFTQEEADDADRYEASGDYESLLPLSYKLYFGRGSKDEAYWIAICLKELHQYTEAIKWYRTVIKEEGEKYDTLLDLGALYQQTGNLEAARDVFEKIRGMEFPEKEQVYCMTTGMLADVYLELGEKDKAIKCLEEIIAKSKDPQEVEYTKETKAQWESIQEK